MLMFSMYNVYHFHHLCLKCLHANIRQLAPNTTSPAEADGNVVHLSYIFDHRKMMALEQRSGESKSLS